MKKTGRVTYFDNDTGMGLLECTEGEKFAFSFDDIEHSSGLLKNELVSFIKSPGQRARNIKSILETKEKF